MEWQRVEKFGSCCGSQSRANCKSGHYPAETLVDIAQIPTDIKVILRTEPVMKTFAVLTIIVAVALESFADQPCGKSGASNTSTNVVVQAETKAQTVTTTRSLEIRAPAKTAKANEIKKGRLSYAGAAVQVVKTKNPLQLINPFAPKEYGMAEDNVTRDLPTGQVTGVNVFTVKF